MTTARVVSRNATVLMMGHGVSYAMRVLYLGVLARYAGPDGIGSISTATSLVAILVLVVSFGLDTLLVRDVAADGARTRTYVSQVIVLRLGLTLLFVPLLLAAMTLSSYTPETRTIIGIYGLAYILDTFYAVARAVFHAHQRMGYGAAVEVGRDIINVVASIVAISLRWPLVAIVMISAGASAVKLVAGMELMRWRFVRPTLRVDLRACLRLLHSAVPFAAVLALGVIYAQINTVLLSWWSTSEAVGLFSSAAMPITILFIVPTVVMESVLPAFSSYGGQPSAGLTRSYQVSFKALLVVGFAVGAGVLVVAPDIIRIVYGPAFGGAVLALRIMAVQLFGMVGYVNGAFLHATNQQARFARIRIGLTALNAVLCLLLIPPWGYLGAATAAVVPGILDFFVYTALCHTYLGLSYPWGILLRAGVSATAMAVVSVAALEVGVPLVAVIVLVAPIVYGGGLVALRVFDPTEYAFLDSIVPLAGWRRRLRALMGLGGGVP
jgi:O-antigen/teichoic acid export membrane protein